MIGQLHTLALFYRRHLRVQPLRELMAIAGVAAGVALLFSVQVAHSSIVGSFEEVAHGVAGHATLELAARSPAGFPESIAAEVARMPGVAASAPLLTVPIRAAGRGGHRERRALTLVGADERVLDLHGRLSTAFQHAAETSQRGLLLLSASTAQAIGVRVGGPVTVLLAGHTEHMTLDATLGTSAIGAAAQSPIAAAPLEIVQNMAGLSGRVTRVLIEPAPGAEAKVLERLTARYGSKLNPRPLDTEAHLLADVASAERQVTLLFSVISLVAGIVLAYNALLLASAERRRFVVRQHNVDQRLIITAAWAEAPLAPAKRAHPCDAVPCRSHAAGGRRSIRHRAADRAAPPPHCNSSGCADRHRATPACPDRPAPAKPDREYPGRSRPATCPADGPHPPRSCTSARS